MILDKGLYNLASSAARFHDKLASSLSKMGFVPSKADYDLWMRSKGDHYEHIATWVDDLLVLANNLWKSLRRLRKHMI